MIKANELRIGNWVSTYGAYRQVYGVNKSSCSFDVPNAKPSNFKCKDIHPIPLTPELLEKCGFVYDEGMKHWQHPIDESGIFIQQGLRIRNKEGIRVNYFTDGYFVETYYSGIEIKSLHQLQNLYYALTGEEIKINF